MCASQRDVIEWQEKVLRIGSEMRERLRKSIEEGKSVYTGRSPSKIKLFYPQRIHLFLWPCTDAVIPNQRCVYKFRVLGKIFFLLC